MSERPVVLATVGTEMLASVIVARLESEGIPAELSGGITLGFQPEAKGGVQILVRPEDEQRAREVMEKKQEGD